MFHMKKLLIKLQEWIKIQQVKDRLDGKKRWWVWIVPKSFTRPS